MSLTNLYLYGALHRPELVVERLGILNKLFDAIQKKLRDLEARIITIDQARHAIKRRFE
jgi:hypothetical protein